MRDLGRKVFGITGALVLALNVYGAKKLPEPKSSQRNEKIGTLEDVNYDGTFEVLLREDINNDGLEDIIMAEGGEVIYFRREQEGVVLRQKQIIYDGKKVEMMRSVKEKGDMYLYVYCGGDELNIFKLGHNGLFYKVVEPSDLEWKD